jgi:translation initiation factor 4G
LTGAIELIVKKAQDEPHFAAMYAALCLKLSRTPMEFEEEGKKKIFKKMLLTQCQKEFETDTNYKMEKAIEGVEDEEERQLKKSIVKKHYLGHMRFIGELYKGDLISIKIMLMVLPQLLEGNGENGEVDEEKVECFAKLMAVIGLILEQQSVRLRDIGKSGSFDKLKEFWDIVENFAGESKGGTVSNRIKFMLQDLLEMRDNGECMIIYRYYSRRRFIFTFS